MVVQTKFDLGLIVYRLTPDGAVKVWNRPLQALRRESSPLVHDRAVYLMDHGVHYCFDLLTGRENWRKAALSEIASPIYADGKIFVLSKSGSFLSILRANAQSREELGKVTVDAQWVPSPCIEQGRLVLRRKNSIACWALTPQR